MRVSQFFVNTHLHNGLSQTTEIESPSDSLETSPVTELLATFVLANRANAVGKIIGPIPRQHRFAWTLKLSSGLLVQVTGPESHRGQQRQTRPYSRATSILN